MTNTEELRERFEERYYMYNPKNATDDRIPTWNGADFEDMFAFLHSEIEAAEKAKVEALLSLLISLQLVK